MIFTMSNNMLERLLPSSFGDMKDLQCLDLSGNKLTGDLPIGLARKGSKLNFLRLSNNMLKGEIFPVLTNINNFAYLFLDGNNFSGPIPQALSTASLISLDLSYNNLSGNLPVWLGNISSLASLALSGNHLRGHIPPDYCRLERLEVLDLSENNLIGAIPSCFIGAIPPQLCHASYLRMLDLSHNNISGPIPHSLGNIMQNPWDTDVYYSSSFGYGGFEIFGGDTLIDVDDSFEATSTISFPNSFGAWVGVEFTTKYNTYSYEGSILSYMFGVDLTGLTPQRTAQFATFDENSYEGNPFLCGPPLHISCTEAKEIPTHLPAPNFSEDDASF
ncbi:hypothetical protein R3W88_028617 [Solanum pinnatisectum]|uniref:Uncharacterized protein n=1 Tax=Solanum pinnatisectum TaxID=50273 RepID=A0AAV9K379_9SOLN|nr:hypothetical protein R3W88_028617 [Solanum pinnatisectum]